MQSWEGSVVRVVVRGKLKGERGQLCCRFYIPARVLRNTCTDLLFWNYH